MLQCSYPTPTCVWHNSRTLHSDLSHIFTRAHLWLYSGRDQTILEVISSGDQITDLSTNTLAYEAAFSMKTALNLSTGLRVGLLHDEEVGTMLYDEIIYCCRSPSYGTDTWPAGIDDKTMAFPMRPRWKHTIGRADFNPSATLFQCPGIQSMVTFNQRS